MSSTRIAWTPAGDALLYAGPEDPRAPDRDPHSTLWRGGPAGWQRLWTVSPADEEPLLTVGLQWSPTGERLLVRLRTAEATGLDGMRLLSFEFDPKSGAAVSPPLELSVVGTHVSWASDGRRFVATTLGVIPDDANDPVPDDGDLYIHDLETDAVTWASFNDDSNDAAPAWSPVDDTIVFVRRDVDAYRIMIWRPERNDPPRLLRDAPCWVESLTWFPQGDRLLVRCTQDPSPVFTVLDADGTEIVGVREGAAGEISADGTRLFVRLGLPGDMKISMLELETFEVSEIATGSSATWRPHG